MRGNCFTDEYASADIGILLYFLLVYFKFIKQSKNNRSKTEDITAMDFMNAEYSEVNSSLAYIDKEYENPQVKNAVHMLLQEEMRQFTPSSSYLKHLPYPTLKFSNSIMLQAEYTRVRDNGPSTMDKLDTTRYTVDQPIVGLEKDVQAWRGAVSNAKSQREHQINRIMNLQLAESHIGPLWLKHNKMLEGYEKQLDEQSTTLKRKIDEISVQRRQEQESVYPALLKHSKRSTQAIWTQWQVFI